jgi:putative ABC transport system permease protein
LSESESIRLAIGVIVMLGIAIAVSRSAHLDISRALTVASVRAAIQLAVVAAALRGVFAAPATSVLVIGVMFSVAVWTVMARLGRRDRAIRRAVLIACGTGAFTAIAIIVGLPTLDRNVRTLVAVSGIVIGGVMTGATLAGRHLANGLHQHRDEIEGWLAIGASPRQAVRDVARRAAREALVPAIDQTRTTGLVTLPGAFIGALLGGASAVGAARFQIVVLVGLLCAQTIAASVLTYSLGAPKVLPAEPVN